MVEKEKEGEQNGEEWGRKKKTNKTNYTGMKKKKREGGTKIIRNEAINTKQTHARRDESPTCHSQLCKSPKQNK